MLPPLSEEWIREQIELCEKATPGPWMLGWPGEQWPMARRCVSNCDGKSIILAGTDRHGYYPTGIQTEADGLFIVAARERYPKVLERLVILQKAINDVAAFVEAHRSSPYCDLLCSALYTLRTDIKKETKYEKNTTENDRRRYRELE